MQVNGNGPGVRVWALPGTSVNNPAGVYWWDEDGLTISGTWEYLAAKWDAWKAQEQDREQGPFPDHNGRPDTLRDSSSDEDDPSNPMDQVD